MESKAKILNKTIDIVLGHDSGPVDYPPRLFKYREANERNINAFHDGKAWFQSPKGWTDPKDCKVLYDEKECVKELMNRRFELRIDLCKRVLGKNAFRHMLEKPGGRDDWAIVSDVMDNAVNAEGIIERRLLLKQLVKHFGQGQAIKLTEKIMKAADEALSPKKMKPLKENLEKLVKAINIRDRYNFLCLTERYDNDKMWNEYANGGFCIEYDATKFPCDGKGLNGLFPVLYGAKDPFDVIEFLRNFCLCFTKKQEKALIADWTRRLFSEIMRKEKKYGGEEEWRIAHPGTQGQLLDFDYAIALYIDEIIDSKWSAELMNIAETKNLDVYIRKKDSDRLGAYRYEQIRTAAH